MTLEFQVWTLAADNPAGGWVCCGVGLVLIIAIGVVFAKPTKCELCGGGIKRTFYTWKIQGKKKKVCPNCNRSIERRASKAATDRLFGE